jgi:hypothetical protein
MVNVTLQLLPLQVARLIWSEPLGLHVVLSPPLAVVLVCAQVSVTVPV